MWKSRVKKMSFFNYRKKRKRRFGGLSVSYHQGAQYRKRYTRRREKRAGKRGWKIAAVVLLVFCILAGGCVGGFYYLKSAGKSSLQKAAGEDAPRIGDEEGVIFRNGKKYQFNKNVMTFLCMGIDTETDLSEIQEVSGSSGQADTIFLVVLNPDTGKMKIIGISRDTMTKIRTYDYHGNYIGEAENHLGLAYAFGDGGKVSSEMMVDAVSKLFYELPVHGYFAVNLKAIEKLNNAVGGVSVTMPEDMVLGTQSYSQGENVLLTGAEAESFVRQRDTEAEGSNNQRMNRQKVYALAFLRAAKAALRKDPLLVADMYSDLKDEMVTSLSVDQAVYLATEITGMSLNMDEIQMLEGTTKQGQIYEEFYVDDAALQDLIIDTFYTEVE